MKCERKQREGSEKEGKFWLKYFEGSEKWSSPKFATVISHGFWTDMTTHNLWAPQSPYIYVGAIEFPISVFENTHLLFPVSIALTQIFEFWVMETGVENQAKHKIFYRTHMFWKLGYENWVIWSKKPLIQTGP